MFRDADEELQRLEEELLAQEEEDEEEDEEYDEDDEDEEYDDDEPEYEVIPAPVKNYKVYNSDKTDVNMNRYSEDVYSGRKTGCLAWLFVILTAAVLVVLYLYLKQGGYV